MSDVVAMSVVQMLTFDLTIAFLAYHVLRSPLLHPWAKGAMLGVMTAQVGVHTTMAVVPDTTCNPDDGPTWCNAIAMGFGVAYVSTFTFLSARRASCVHIFGLVVGAIMYASHLVTVPWGLVF